MNKIFEKILLFTVVACSFYSTYKPYYYLLNRKVIQ
jgi:hypothetical protein